MTPEEITRMQTPEVAEFDAPVLAIAGVSFWLKEIAYQLALINEQKTFEIQRESERRNWS